MAAGSGSQEQWSSTWGFLLAAVGFAVGMGNIWRFPYQLGENGGAAFLILYLACALAIGLPLLITEISMGRRGGASASASVMNVAAEVGASRRWGFIGNLGIFCAFIILTYYTVLSGWTLDYFVKAATGGHGADVCIEAIGLPEVYRQAFEARDLAGTVVLVGVPTPEMTIELPFQEVFGRGGALKSSWYGDCLPSRDFPMLIDLYLQGRLDLDRFVSETISLDDVEEAFHKMERGEVLRSVVVL